MPAIGPVAFACGFHAPTASVGSVQSVVRLAPPRSASAVPEHVMPAASSGRRSTIVPELYGDGNANVSRPESHESKRSVISPNGLRWIVAGSNAGGKRPFCTSSIGIVTLLPMSVPTPISQVCAPAGENVYQDATTRSSGRCSTNRPWPLCAGSNQPPVTFVLWNGLAPATTSSCPDAPPAAMFSALVANAIALQSGENATKLDAPFALPPPGGCDSLTMTLLPRSRANTSRAPSSPDTRFDATDSNVTYWPAPQVPGRSLSPLPSPPTVLSDTRCRPTTWLDVVDISARNTSRRALLSPGTRFDAA